MLEFFEPNQVADLVSGVLGAPRSQRVHMDAVLAGELRGRTAGVELPKELNDLRFGEAASSASAGVLLLASSTPVNSQLSFA